MRYSLTIVYCTSRKQPYLKWALDSLALQLGENEPIPDFTVIDYYRAEREQNWLGYLFSDSILKRHQGKNIPRVKHANCLPTIWQGKYQLPREPWWAKSAYLNAGIIYCQTEFIAFLDDRAVLGPEWLQAIRRAMDGDFAVCGSYEKRANMKVENGVMTDPGELLGVDTRIPGLYDFDSWYGGSGALSLEWCLKVNGFSTDICDSAGTEDSMFGVTLRNNNLPIKYDSAMRIIEDRTPGQIDGVLKRADKNPHLGQQAKSWAIVRLFKDKLTSQNSYDIRNLRDRVLLNGESLDSFVPTASYQDWYDGSEIKEMI